MKILKNIKSTLFQKNIEVGYLYFYVHMITEILCFFSLGKIIGNWTLLWVIPFIYDALAFVPQSIIGYINDRYPKLNTGLIGISLLLIGFILFNLNILNIYFIPLILICLGNAFIHVSGAELTLRESNGNLSHSAIFVSGGSFGVIIGKLLSKTNLSFIILIILGLTMIPFVLLAEEHKNDKKYIANNFNYHNKKIDSKIIILLAVLVVIFRGYIGYGIPTSWNKTVFETILLYVFMGCGKALGGIISDTFGIRKVAVISTIGALPFLIFGNELMVVSLIGVLLFSMTMSLTLGILVSVLKNKPGLAFGWTTIGLFIGTIPIFFIRFPLLINCIIIIIVSLVCLLILLKIIRRRDIKYE